MAIRRYTQTTFTQGERKFIKGRAELGMLGLETCENMILLPQGGIDRRRGSNLYLLDSSTLADGSTDVVTGSFHSQSRLIPFIW